MTTSSPFTFGLNLFVDVPPPHSGLDPERVGMATVAAYQMMQRLDALDIAPREVASALTQVLSQIDLGSDVFPPCPWHP